jgi:hypothetical protein
MPRAFARRYSACFVVPLMARSRLRGLAAARSRPGRIVPTHGAAAFAAAASADMRFSFPLLLIGLAALLPQSDACSSPLRPRIRTAALPQTIRYAAIGRQGAIPNSLPCRCRRLCERCHRRQACCGHLGTADIYGRVADRSAFRPSIASYDCWSLSFARSPRVASLGHPRLIEGADVVEAQAEKLISSVIFGSGSQRVLSD